MKIPVTTADIEYNTNITQLTVNQENNPYIIGLITKTSYGGPTHVPQRIPPGIEQTIGGRIGQAALYVINGVSRTSQETQGTKLSKDQQWDFDQQIRQREEVALRGWLLEHPQFFMPEKDFTAIWEDQGSIEGAEHQLYFSGDYIIKRNNLNYHTTWLQYLDRIALHNWLFNSVPLELIGITEVSGQLQPVVKQPIIKVERGATRTEVEDQMTKLEFTRTKNDDYVHKLGYLLVEDLHDENAVITPNGFLIIFDPVIYRLNP